MAGASPLRYRPLNLARWLTWGLTALVMAVLPLLFTQGFGRTLEYFCTFSVFSIA